MSIEENEMAFRAFKKYLRLQNLRGLPVEKMLNSTIMNWLALAHVRDWLKLDEKLPHEVVSLFEYIKAKTKEPWQAKAAKTRQKTKKRNQELKSQKRQLSFRF